MRSPSLFLTVGWNHWLSPTMILVEIRRDDVTVENICHNGSCLEKNCTHQVSRGAFGKPVSSARAPPLFIRNPHQTARPNVQLWSKWVLFAVELEAN